jgi:hypothetical protein
LFLCGLRKKQDKQNVLGLGALALLLALTFGFDFWLLIWLLRFWAFGRLRKQRIF